MAGYITNGMAIDYHDGEGSCTIGKQRYRWEFHHYCGPTFYVNGSKKGWIPAEKHPVWDYFNAWLEKYNEARKTAKSWEIVKV